MSRYFLSAKRLRFVLVLGALAIVTGLAVRGSWAELTGPSANDRQVTRIVTSLLRNDHLFQHELDDEMAERCLTTFLKTLDPLKSYFYQSDVDQFLSMQPEIDDQFMKGDIEFAYKVFNVLLERIDERVGFVDELLATEHDFAVDEELITDPEMMHYAKDRAEAYEVWRKRIKYDLLFLKADAADKAAHKDDPKLKTPPKRNDPDQSPVQRLTRRYHSFAKRMHQTDHDELLEMYLTSLTSAYDPHTSYMSPSSEENFAIQLRLNLDGIGAALQSTDGFTVVSKIIPGGAADKDGRLKADDRIIGVGQGAGGAIVDTVDMKLSDVVALVRGKAGTIVRLQVAPASGAENQTYDITRAKIELKDSEARSEILEEADGDKTVRVGVIDLPSFYMDMEAARNGDSDFKSTTRDVALLLEDFRAKHVDAVILDLRQNGGGSLTEAISLTGLFIDQGPIVQVKDRDNRVQHYDDMEPGVAWDGPLVVLTSKFSASASEIFAGAIQDYRRGIIVGDSSTHGKGTVQTLLDLGRQLFRVPNAPKLGALKITVQQFYRPNGDSTQNRGVMADVKLPSLSDALEGISEADLDYCLKFDNVEGAAYDKVDLVEESEVDTLNQLSTARCSKSEGFQKVMRDIERYREQKGRKSVTLNEAKFLAERAELNAEREEERELDKLNDPNKPVFDRSDFYNAETVAITLDYVRMRRAAQNN